MIHLLFTTINIRVRYSSLISLWLSQVSLEMLFVICCKLNKYHVLCQLLQYWDMSPRISDGDKRESLCAQYPSFDSWYFTRGECYCVQNTFYMEFVKHSDFFVFWSFSNANKKILFMIDTHKLGTKFIKAWWHIRKGSLIRTVSLSLSNGDIFSKTNPFINSLKSTSICW